MKTKNTLILFAVALGLFAFIFFFEKKTNSTRENMEQSKRVVTVDVPAIDGIQIANNEGKIELRKDGPDWNLVAPLKDRADSLLVNQVLTNIDDLNVESSFVVDGKAADGNSLKDLGLDTAGIRLKLLGKGAPPEILFGKDAAVEGKSYVRMDGSNTVYVVSNELKKQLQKKVDDYRDRKLIGLDVSRVSKFNIKSAAGEIDMAKSTNAWSLDQPIKARGDSMKINDLIAQISSMHVDAFVPDTSANPGAWGLSDPRGTITLAIDGADKPEVLQIGQPVEGNPNEVYARLSSRDSVLILPKSIAAVLEIKPADVRSRGLMALNLDMVDRIHIDAANKPRITLARKLEEWTLKTSGDAPANIVMVATLATALRDLQVTAFVSDVDSDLAKYGLDKPQVKVAFSSYASENTAESKAGEVPIATVDLGKADGAVVYAKIEGEPFIVSVPRSILNSIPADPVLWQDLSIYKLKPADITSLEIMRNGATVALERSGTADWRITKGTGAADKNAVQTLLNTLSTLRAVQWVSSSSAGFGFEKPALVVSFSTADKKSGRLTVGNSTSESMWNAMTDGRNGVFLMSMPDYGALNAELTAPAATPSPSPSATGAVTPAGVQ